MSIARACVKKSSEIILKNGRAPLFKTITNIFSMSSLCTNTEKHTNSQNSVIKSNREELSHIFSHINNVVTETSLYTTSSSNRNKSPTRQHLFSPSRQNFQTSTISFALPPSLTCSSGDAQSSPSAKLLTWCSGSWGGFWVGPESALLHNTATTTLAPSLSTTPQHY